MAQQQQTADRDKGFFTNTGKLTLLTSNITDWKLERVGMATASVPAFT